MKYTKEQIDYIKHCGEHFEILIGGKGHSKTKEIIEQLENNWDELKKRLKEQQKICSAHDNRVGFNFIELVLNEMQEIEGGVDNE